MGNKNKSKSKRLNSAGIITRVLAYLLDVLIVSPIFLTPYFLNITLYSKDRVVLYVGLYSLSYLYLILFPVYFGGTLGKLALKIKIVNEEGNYITLKQSILRWSPYLLLFLVLIILLFLPKVGAMFTVLNVINKLGNFFGLFEAIVLIFDKNNRAIHDYIAKTFVVER